jgi:hypothetical protein
MEEGQSVLTFCAAKGNVENCARLVAACLAATAAAAAQSAVRITTAATVDGAATANGSNSITAGDMHPDATAAAATATAVASTTATGTSATAAVQRAALIEELRGTTVGLCPILEELIPHGKCFY